MLFQFICHPCAKGKPIFPSSWSISFSSLPHPWTKQSKPSLRQPCAPWFAIAGLATFESCEPLEPEVSNPTLEEKVRREILAACQRANWKLGGPRGAAARLGLKRTTLFYKMKRLGIAAPADHWQD